MQTLYLALATGLIAAMLFSLKAVVPGADGSFIQEIKYTAYVPYLILLIVIVLLDFLALTAFRFRVFQMRTAVLAVRQCLQPSSPWPCRHGSPSTISPQTIPSYSALRRSSPSSHSFSTYWLQGA